MSRLARFQGRIAGWGTASGTRVVVGRWDFSPLGGFADVMVERPDGERLLLAPTEGIAAFVSSTYRFDRVEVVPVTVRDDAEDGDGSRHDRDASRRDGDASRRDGDGSRHDGRAGVPAPWLVDAGPLSARVVVGPRTGLGRLLRLVPGRLATSPRFTGLTDPAARVLLHGVRTRGSAGSGRVEHYGATDVHAVVAVASTWGDEALGGLAPVDPPVRFGFGSTPRRPAVTDVVTTIVLPAAG
ncbi:hypothetical protein [Cellulosimicrobium arenosum]|uniref:Uncharacterized protein n=1 Tax=Cellulosimicrobium arenosum TaxID=2708133 RepID=A0A927PEA9_9MICO|nr:hypothetical protein [Cellulosimicrobium arenosum]MBD8079938.1 hypothetical protein [Cellulosimicrobium arenosum]